VIDACAVLFERDVDVSLSRGRPGMPARSVVRPPAAPPAVHDLRVDHAMRQIERQYVDPSVSLAAVARELRLSSARLTTLLKRQTGATFSAHVHARRLRQAEGLLTTTDRSIKDIAWAVGYRRTSHLDRHFRDMFGVAPAAYRTSRRLE